MTGICGPSGPFAMYSSDPAGHRDTFGPATDVTGIPLYVWDLLSERRSPSDRRQPRTELNGRLPSVILVQLVLACYQFDDP
jgi:hypothetical protein